MNNQPGMTFDLKPFNAAMASYAAYTGKDLAYSLNRAMKNICYAAMKHIPRASVHAIQMLYAQPKLIAWTLRKIAEKGVSGFAMRHHTEKVQLGVYARGKKKGQAKFGKVSSINFDSVGKYYSRDFAVEFADKFVQSRKRRVGFVRSFYLRMAKAIQASIPGGGQRQGAKDAKEVLPAITLATPANLTAQMMATYNFKKEKNSDTTKIDAILDAALQPAISDVIADVTKYIEEGLSRQARAISTSY